MEKIPKDFSKILSDDELQATVLQLDSAVRELVEVGTQRENAYENRSVLLKSVRGLQTEIQLAESDAIMQIQGSGKDAYAIVNGIKIALTNDTSRDAYRHNASRNYRQELAVYEGELAKLNSDLDRLNDMYNAKVDALRGLQAKANLQAAYLNYLA